MKYKKIRVQAPCGTNKSYGTPKKRERFRVEMVIVQ